MIKFLQAVRRLAELGVKKEDIIKFGKIEFGEITELLSKQVDDIYKRFYKDKGGSIFKDKSKIGEFFGFKNFPKKAEKKKGEVVDIKTGKKLDVTPTEKNTRDMMRGDVTGEGIASLTEKEMVESALKKITNRKRLGTRSQESNIRTAVREFLERRIKDGSLTIPDKKDLDAITGVKQGGVDPIDVFRKAYGEDAIGVVARIEDEFPNAFRGDSFKEIGDNFEKLFKLDKENISSELPTPKKNYGYDEGLMTDEQLKETLEKDLKEKEMLEDFNPTDREPNATGGLTRTSYAMGRGPVLPRDPVLPRGPVLPSDEDPINPFQPKPMGPVLPDKSMMASYGYDDAMGESFAEFQRLKKLGEIPADMEFDEYLDLLDIDIPYSKKQKQAPSIKLASGFESYKDFIESTGDEELMELYSEGLNAGDFTKLFEALRRKGYQGRDDIATGGRVQAASGGLAEILKV